MHRNQGKNMLKSYKSSKEIFSFEERFQVRKMTI